jgi:F-type H+-transporting ATPase subunit b
VAFYWESFVFAIVAFLILLWLLSRYAFGPLINVMEKRREQVLNEMASAEQSRKEAEKFLAEQRQAMENVREEAAKILEQARKSSAKQAEEILAKASAEAARLKEEALRDIENEKKQAIASLRSQVSAMSVMIASKILEKQIDAQSQEQLIDQYLKDVGEIQ